MRISTQQQYNINIQRMQNSQTTIGDLQRQISTGKKIAQPSDNPAVAAEVVRLNRDIAALDRYEGNIKIADNRLSLEETTVGTMTTQIDRMRELTISAGSGTKNSANLKTIATEIREIVASLAGAMNKQDSQGEYIFAGSKGHTLPYELNPDGRWEYKGDNGQREIQIGATHYIDSNDSGQYLFESVEGKLEFEASGASTVDPATQFTYADDAAKEQFEAYLKAEVTGDLHIRHRVVVADPVPANAQYEFEIIDSAGKLHYPPPPPPPTIPPTPPPSTLLTGEVQTIEFEGVTIALSPLETNEYTFPEQGKRQGIEKITIDDQAAMDQFFADYGEVEVRFDATTAGSETYQLMSARTGELIELHESDTFTMPVPGPISFGGLTLDVDGTTTGNYLLKPPTKDDVITQLGPFESVTVSDPATFEALFDDDPDGALWPGKAAALPKDTAITSLQMIVSDDGSGDFEYDIVDQNGTSVLAGAVPLAPFGDPLVTQAGVITDPTTGLSFHHGGQLDFDDAYTITLREGTANDPADPYHNEAVAETRVKLQYEQKNILNVGLELAERLELGNGTPELVDGLNEVLGDTLGYITQAQDRITEAITGVGARLSAMDDTLNANTDIKLFTKTTLSSIEDADLPAVASQLKLEEILLQASQQTFASTSRMTLFDYIN